MVVSTGSNCAGAGGLERNILNKFHGPSQTLGIVGGVSRKDSFRNILTHTHTHTNATTYKLNSTPWGSANPNPSHHNAALTFGVGAIKTPIVANMLHYSQVATDSQQLNMRDFQTTKGPMWRVPLRRNVAFWTV